MGVLQGEGEVKAQLLGEAVQGRKRSGREQHAADLQGLQCLHGHARIKAPVGQSGHLLYTCSHHNCPSFIHWLSTNDTYYTVQKHLVS